MSHSFDSIDRSKVLPRELLGGEKKNEGMANRGPATGRRKEKDSRRRQDNKPEEGQIEKKKRLLPPYRGGRISTTQEARGKLGEALPLQKTTHSLASWAEKGGKKEINMLEKKRRVEPFN